MSHTIRDLKHKKKKRMAMLGTALAIDDIRISWLQGLKGRIMSNVSAVTGINLPELEEVLG